MTATERYRLGIACALVCALGLAPTLGGEYTRTIATEILIAGVFAAGVNLLLGYTGLVSLGTAMFLGIGGYGLGAFGVLAHLPLWIAVPATLFAAALLGAVIGIICIRARDVQFLLITFAFCELLHGVAQNLDLLGGADGMTGLPRPDLGWLGVDENRSTAFYAYVGAVTTVVFGLQYALLRTPFGSVIVGIRENERRMTAMGYNVPFYKIATFVLSSVVAAIAGILQAQYSYYVNPQTMTWEMSGEGLLMAIMGGTRYVLGPLAGAASFVFVRQALGALMQDYVILFGLFFMAVVAFFRHGLLGWLDKLLLNLSSWRGPHA